MKRQARRRRRRAVRGRTINISRVSLADRDRARRGASGHWAPADGRCLDVETFCPVCDTVMRRVDLPGECPGCGAHRVFRCPWVGCRWHLYLDVNPLNGSIKLNFPGLQVWELAHTCALDEAWLSEACLESIGQKINLGRSRVQKLERLLMRRLLAEIESRGQRRELLGQLSELDDLRAGRDTRDLYAFDVGGLFRDVDTAYKAFRRRSAGCVDDDPGDDLEGLRIVEVQRGDD